MTTYTIAITKRMWVLIQEAAKKANCEIKIISTTLLLTTLTAKFKTDFDVMKFVRKGTNAEEAVSDFEEAISNLESIEGELDSVTESLDASITK